MGVVMNYNVIKWVWIRYSMPRPVLDTRNRSTGIEYSSTLVSNRPSLRTRARTQQEETELLIAYIELETGTSS